MAVAWLREVRPLPSATRREEVAGRLVRHALDAAFREARA
jgi:hypothetical protein